MHQLAFRSPFLPSSFRAVRDDDRLPAYPVALALARYVGIRHASGVDHLVRPQLTMRQPHLHQGRGVVGETEIQPVAAQLALL